MTPPLFIFIIMFYKWQNIIRHILILIISLGLLWPCAWLINKSYYTTISKVNYWEEKQIVGLLSFILKNTETEAVKNNLIESLNTINFFEIIIEHNNVIIANKKLDRELDKSSTKVYHINDYNIVITKRKYNTFTKDYSEFIINLGKGNWGGHIFYVYALSFLSLFLFIEILFISISIKVKLNNLVRDIRR